MLTLHSQNSLQTDFYFLFYSQQIFTELSRYFLHKIISWLLLIYNFLVTYSQVAGTFYITQYIFIHVHLFQIIYCLFPFINSSGNCDTCSLLLLITRGV